MPKFIRTVSDYNKEYTETLININYIGSITTCRENPELLKIHETPTSYTNPTYVFKKDLMCLLDACNQELIDQITEKQNP